LTARGLADKLLGSAPPVALRRAIPGWEGGTFVPLIVVKEDESFENALRRFKRKCEKSGILSELKKRQHYEKPSAKRKRKAIAARKKMLRKLAEERRTGM